MSEPRPSVLVLLATYNGAPFIEEQLRSILDQERVDVRVLVSDDGSTDGTLEIIAGLADQRVAVLPTIAPSGSSFLNFARLIRDARPREHELVAFADQDDRWALHKLITQADAIAGGAGAVSGSVMAFRDDGSRFLVRKDRPQRRFDFLTESPGPGCTFVLTRPVFDAVADVLDRVPSASSADFHDSLIYAVGRGAGFRWSILGEPLLDYRQHSTNVMGANRGFAAASTRFRMLRSHWHREQAVIHATAALAVAPTESRPELEHMLALLTSTRWRDLVALATRARFLRRRWRDQVILGVMIVVGLW